VIMKENLQNMRLLQYSLVLLCLHWFVHGKTM
jgi:hypothetical protein